jgi:hypothetical protein
VTWLVTPNKNKNRCIGVLPPDLPERIKGTTLETEAMGVGGEMLVRTKRELSVLALRMTSEYGRSFWMLRFP